MICAAVEYAGGTEGQVFQVIDEKVRANTAETLDRMRRDKILPREAAVDKAMQYQRFGSRSRFEQPGVESVVRAVV